MRRRASPVLVLLQGLVAGLLICGGLAGCANPSNPTNPNQSNPSNPQQIPSCLPPGYRPRAIGAAGTQPPPEVKGEELDVMLAVVEGDVITKRRLLREAGGTLPGQDPAVLERQLHQRLKDRARLLLFVKEAQRSGVMVRDSLLDQVVEDELKRRTKEAEETIGRPVGVAEYLEDKGLTPNEFRKQVKEQLQYQAYVIRLKEGLGGPMRPQVDMDVSPAEVRRIYRDHPNAFDEKAGVRFAFFQLPVDRWLTDDVGVLDAEELAFAEAEKLSAAWEGGASAEDIAKRFELDEGMWRALGEDEFAEEGAGIRFPPKVDAWLFDSTRSGRETLIHSDATGPVVFAFLERRTGRRVPYNEAYSVIVKMVQEVRTQRIILEKLLSILSTRNVVQPPDLAAEMLSDARSAMAEIDGNPILSSAKFR